MAENPGGNDHHRGRRDQGWRSGPIRGRRLCPQAVYGRPNQGEAGWDPGAGAVPMNLQTILVDYISQSTANVFSTMLGTELGPGEASIDHGIPEVNEGIVSFIGLAGAWAGTGSIVCSPTVACRICSLLLMTETSSVDADVLDAVAELTNMIVGSVTNELEPHIGPLGLSIPTLVV